MEVPVFTETSLGTRVALSAPPDISAAELKRRLEREYFGGFPGSGPVRAHGLMVKRRSFFYHLPDSMPIKYVFDGAARAWFLHADLRPSDDLSEPRLQDCIATDDHLHASWSSFKTPNDRKGEIWAKSLERPLLKCQENAIHSKEKGNNSWLESRHLNRNEENESHAPRVAADNLCEPERSSNPDQMDETSNGSSSAISVGGIIERYFCPNDVTDCITTPVSESKAVQSWAKERTNASAEFAVKTPPRPSLRDRGERSRVGKRLVTASYLLGVSPTQKTVPDLCRSQNGKVSRCSHGIRYPVFEISDSSDNNQSNS